MASWLDNDAGGEAGAELANILTNAFILCSVQHAAVNDSQFDQSAILAQLEGLPLD